MSFGGGIPHMASGGGYGGVEVPGSRHRPPSSSATRHDEKMSRANGEASTKATPEDFRVEKVISKGSFGTVYLALLQSKPFAMKVVDLHDMNRQEREEAKDEARVLRSLRHTCIVSCLDAFIASADLGRTKKLIGASSKQLFIIMEYCEGGNLYTVSHTKSKLMPEKLIWRYFIQSLIGLNHIHKNNIIHRDIKSMNIFLSSDKATPSTGNASPPPLNAKIGDVGIAKVMSNETVLAHSIVGTPYYFSPELCNDKPYDDKSDVWALGVVFYEMCTGKMPFEAQNQGALIKKIIRGAYPPINSHAHGGGGAAAGGGAHASGVNRSPQCSNIVKMMLAFDPRNRMSTDELLRSSIVVSKAREVGVSLSQRDYIVDASKDATMNEYEMLLAAKHAQQQQQHQQHVNAKELKNFEDAAATGAVTSRLVPVSGVNAGTNSGLQRGVVHKAAPPSSSPHKAPTEAFNTPSIVNANPNANYAAFGPPGRDTLKRYYDEQQRKSSQRAHQQQQHRNVIGVATHTNADAGAEGGVETTKNSVHRRNEGRQGAAAPPTTTSAQSRPAAGAHRAATPPAAALADNLEKGLRLGNNRRPVSQVVHDADISNDDGMYGRKHAAASDARNAVAAGAAVGHRGKAVSEDAGFDFLKDDANCEVSIDARGMRDVDVHQFRTAGAARRPDVRADEDVHNQFQRLGSAAAAAPFASYDMNHYQTSSRALQQEAIAQHNYEAPQFARRRAPDLQITGPSMRNGVGGRRPQSARNAHPHAMNNIFTSGSSSTNPASASLAPSSYYSMSIMD